MAYPHEAETGVPDFRVYIGMIFFRWQIIVVFFLYSLLGGVLYLQLAPKQYVARAHVQTFADRNLELSNQASIWVSLNKHSEMLRASHVRQLVADRLAAEWGERMGSPRKLLLQPRIRATPGRWQALEVSVSCTDPGYGKAFLREMLNQHELNWNRERAKYSEGGQAKLSAELARLDERIKATEDELIEYQRLHDIARVEARGAMESSYLNSLVHRRTQLSTQIMLLEAQFPFLKDASVGVIHRVAQLTEETGALGARRMAAEADASSRGENAEPGGDIPPAVLAAASEDVSRGEPLPWQVTRADLEALKQRERQMAADLTPDNPTLIKLRREIKARQSELELAKAMELADLREKHHALTIQRDALESAEYRWQAKNLMVMQRSAEMNRIKVKLDRFVGNYNTLYNRLHDLQLTSEIESQRLRLHAPQASDKPEWPDPVKVLLVALGLGLGAGLGVALVAQVLDNKIQSIRDVEDVLGVPFLGGIPFWVHSGLEKAIRPIVTEEHSTGAIEAYRALRTTVLSALAKINEKVVLVTSADSREGKTLTTLNMAIMIAQMGKKVLLIDFDMRRGRLHRSLGIEKEPGVTDAVRAGSFKDVIVDTRIDNLDLIPVGSTTENAAELLQATDLVAMLAEVQDHYDYVFIDTSPVLRVTDTVILASQGAGVILYVARVNRTPKPLIRYSLDMLRDSRVLGLIMNSIEMHKVSSLYYTYQYPNYAYYSNAYAYGYNYYYYGDGEGGGGRRRRRRRGSSGRRLHDVMEWVRRTFLPME